MTNKQIVYDYGLYDDYVLVKNIETLKMKK